MKSLKFAGQKLKKARKANHLTQQQLAEKVGKTLSDISNYENGFATPPGDVMLSLQKVLNIGFAALCHQEDEEITM